MVNRFIFQNALECSGSAGFCRLFVAGNVWHTAATYHQRHRHNKLSGLANNVKCNFQYYAISADTHSADYCINLFRYALVYSILVATAANIWSGSHSSISGLIWPKDLVLYRWYNLVELLRFSSGRFVYVLGSAFTACTCSRRRYECRKLSLNQQKLQNYYYWTCFWAKLGRSKYSNESWLK